MIKVSHHMTNCSLAKTWPKVPSPMSVVLRLNAQVETYVQFPLADFVRHFFDCFTFCFHAAPSQLHCLL